MPKIITLEFNGYDLSDLLIVNSLKRGVRLGRSSEYRTRKRKRGVDFLSCSSELVSFDMDFTFKYDVKEKRKILSEILNVKEPKPLIFSDEPNRVYYALPKSDIEIIENSSLGEGTITWEIPDGVAYSLHDYLFTNQETGGILGDFIVINNPGSEPIDLDLLANFTSDNGFLGLESESGSVRALFGNMEEVDGYDYQISEKLFNDHLFKDRGWVLNNGVIPPVTDSITQQGTFSYKQEFTEEGFAYPTNYGTPTNSWSGPSLTKIVPADSNGEYPENWSADVRVDFNTDGGGNKSTQVGHQSITFADQDGEVIVAIVIEDNTPTAEKSDLAIYIRNRRVYDSRNTSSYYVTARPGDKNHIHIDKLGDQVTIELAFIGRKLSFELPNAGVFLRKITFYAARYKSFAPIHNNLIRAINVVKHNVDKWQDVPNKFMDGDELVYGKNGRNIFCYLNEMNALELRDVGSTLISAPPGTSQLYLTYSSFSKTPEVTLRGRPKYII